MGLQAARRNFPAVKPSNTWGRWSSQFAWRELATAYDDHLPGLRRDAYERGIEEQAEGVGPGSSQAVRGLPRATRGVRGSTISGAGTPVAVGRPAAVAGNGTLRSEYSPTAYS